MNDEKVEYPDHENQIEKVAVYYPFESNTD